MSSFWNTLKKPISILAPMEDVTDTVFRRVVTNCGRPDVFFTEFTSTDGMLSVGRDRVINRLEYTKDEKPLVAQIWGNNPENYLKACREIQEMGFDGVDINMGCPVGKIVKKGGCSGLIENPNLAKELILAAKEGANKIPVSVKTRLGFSKLDTEKWTTTLLEMDLPVLTMHGRIAKHMSKYPANWDEIKKVVDIKNQMQKDTLIIGNGDVMSYQEIFEKHETTGVDGVMIGRGIFQNLFVFNPNGPKCMTEISAETKLKLLTYHLELHKKRWGESTRYATMKKFYKIYVNTFKEASDLRSSLMETHSIDEALILIAKFSKEYGISKIKEDRATN